VQITQSLLADGVDQHVRAAGANRLDAVIHRAGTRAQPELFRRIPGHGGIEDDAARHHHGVIEYLFQLAARIGDQRAGIILAARQRAGDRDHADLGSAELTEAPLRRCLEAVDAAKIVLMCIEHEIFEQDGLDGFETTPERRFGQFRTPKVRMIAIPSTLSGGEYNSGALVTDTRRKLKQIFNHPMMMPRSIILDPAMTRYTPEKLWLGSGTRAMDHGIEAICSSRPNVLVNAVCQQGLRYLHDGLLRTKQNPDDEEARLSCQLGSWMSAFGLQARVPMGASHAIGHVLGGTCDVPHYFCTAVMMPSVLRYNLPATGTAQKSVSAALGAPGRDAGEAFAAFIAELGLPRRLAEVGVAEDRFELIGKNAMLSIFTRANPQPIREPGDVVKILKLAA